MENTGSISDNSGISHSNVSSADVDGGNQNKTTKQKDETGKFCLGCVSLISLVTLHSFMHVLFEVVFKII